MIRRSAARFFFGKGFDLPNISPIFPPDTSVNGRELILWFIPLCVAHFFLLIEKTLSRVCILSWVILSFCQRLNETKMPPAQRASILRSSGSYYTSKPWASKTSHSTSIGQIVTDTKFRLNQHCLRFCPKVPGAGAMGNLNIDAVPVFLPTLVALIQLVHR